MLLGVGEAACLVRELVFRVRVAERAVLGFRVQQVVSTLVHQVRLVGVLQVLSEHQIVGLRLALVDCTVGQVVTLLLFDSF